MTYKEALINKGYKLTEQCGCGGTPTETYTNMYNKFIVKPKKEYALHYYNNKQIATITPFEIIKYLETI